MKNKTLLVRMVSVMTALTLSVGLFTGCGKDVSDKDEQGRTIISVGGWPAKEGAELTSYNERKARFEEANQDVVVEPSTWMFDLKTFYAKAAGGQLPTVYQTYLTEMPGIIDAGYSADLSSVLEERGYEGKFNEKLIEIVSDDEGNIMGFPSQAYVLGLAFNSELMQQAGLMEDDGTPKQPKDWYELAEFAVKIKEATGKPGFVFPTAGNNGGWLFSPIAWSFGVDFMEKNDDGKWKATFDTPEAVAALQYIKDLKWKYDVLPSNTLIDHAEYFKIFGTGNAGMAITGSDFTLSVLQYGMPATVPGIMALPAGPKRHVTLLGGAVYSMADNATRDQLDASVRWLETFITYDITEEYKRNRSEYFDRRVQSGELVGVQTMSVWSSDLESVKWEQELAREKCNTNPNYVRLYNEFVTDCPAEIQPEEPVCAQELYSILDGCIQKVLSDKDADCEKIIKEAVSDFQKNYLDNLTY